MFDNLLCATIFCSVDHCSALHSLDLFCPDLFSHFLQITIGKTSIWEFMEHANVSSDELLIRDSTYNCNYFQLILLLIFLFLLLFISFINICRQVAWPHAHQARTIVNSSLVQHVRHVRPVSTVLTARWRHTINSYAHGDITVGLGRLRHCPVNQGRFQILKGIKWSETVCPALQAIIAAHKVSVNWNLLYPPWHCTALYNILWLSVYCLFSPFTF